MSSDLLGDIDLLGGSSPGSARSSNHEDISFDFDPDGSIAPPNGGVVDMFSGSKAELGDMFGGTQPATEDLFSSRSAPAPASPPVPVSSASGAASAVSDSPTGLNTVDPDELRRRIKGGAVGSEKPSSLQRIRAAASGAAGGAVGRVGGVCSSLRGRMPEATRGRLGIGFLLILLCVGGGFYSVRQASPLGSLDEVIVTEAAKTPAKPKIRKPSSSSEDSSDAKQSLVDEEISHTAAAVEEAATEPAAAADDGADVPESRSRSSGAVANAASMSKEFLSLRRVVVDSKEQVLAELASLRREVAKLKASQGAAGKQEDGSDTAATRASSAGSSGYGEVEKEKPRRSRRERAADRAAAAEAAASRPSAAASARSSRSRASSSDDDDTDSAASSSDDDAVADTPRRSRSRAASKEDTAASKWAAGDDDSSGGADDGSVGGIREIQSR